MKINLQRSLSVLACLGAISIPVQANEAALLDEARTIPQKMQPRLLEVLQAEIKESGHAGAISVCREKAPQMAKALSEQTGWAIRRVSLKNRNVKAVPDAWEKAVLEEFDQRLAAGEDPAKIEKGEVVSVDGQKTYRYMKALPTQELCLFCHGQANKLAPGVAAKLKDLYPEDKATGYVDKQVRGAITVKKTL